MINLILILCSVIAIPIFISAVTTVWIHNKQKRNKVEYQGNAKKTLLGTSLILAKDIPDWFGQGAIKVVNVKNFEGQILEVDIDDLIESFGLKAVDDLLEKAIIKTKAK